MCSGQVHATLFLRSGTQAFKSSFLFFPRKGEEDLQTHDLQQKLDVEVVKGCQELFQMSFGVDDFN
jgi:hypothetical protein